FDLEFDDFELLRDLSATGTAFSNFDDGKSANTTGGDWSYSWEDAPETSFELVRPGHGSAGFGAHVSGKLDASDDSRLIANFKIDHSPADLSSYSGIRFWVRGNGAFRLRTLQPSISDWDDYGTTLLHAS